MKLLYYSPDDLEIAEVSKQFAQAGIPCVVRHSATCRGEANHACTELWIRHDKDTHKAIMLCVQLGVGFAKRSSETSLIHSWSDISSDVQEESEQEPQIEPVQECPRKRTARTPGLRRALG
jgi:hypothetical protein